MRYSTVVLKSPRMDSSFKATTMFLEGKGTRMGLPQSAHGVSLWFPKTQNSTEVKRVLSQIP